MAFSNQPLDSNSIPIASVYVPNNGFIATEGSTNIDTDGLGNTYAPISVDINQIGEVDVVMGGSDSINAATVLMTMMGLFNGSTVDQQRGNMDTITLINASNVTTTQTSAQQTNYNGRGAIIVLDMIDASASPSVTLSIQGVEPVTGVTWTILTGLAVTTNSTNIYRVYPGLAAVSNATTNDLIPRTWQVTVTANNANSATYKVCTIVMV